ncbi:MAG: endonuclease/exonuclease/phosphatase family protein [Planctomycetota bacterium]|nr:endonuclease/exonuclease/phosphatase family protein [Planctomycetota bacterium]
MNYHSLVLMLLSLGTPVPDGELRVMTWNIHYFVPVTVNADEKVVAAAGGAESVIEGIVTAARRYDLDAIALQEATPRKQVMEAARRLGWQVRWFHGGWTGEGWKHGIPGAIMTRLPILESCDRPDLAPYAIDDAFSRTFGEVVVLHQGDPLVLMTVHLLPAWKNTTEIRLREIAAVKRAAERHRKLSRSVIVMGDANHQPATAEYEAWVKAGFTDSYLASGGDPVGGWTCPSTGLTERIDYIWVTGPLSNQVLEARALADDEFHIDRSEPGDGALSDHIPVLAILGSRQHRSDQGGD